MTPAEKAERKRQAEFERAHTVTDFSEIWRLGVSGAEPEPEVEPDRTIGLVRHRTERVETTATVMVRIGRHVWPEERTVVVYRTRRPCTAQLWGRRCELEHDHSGPHESPASRIPGGFQLALSWES